MKRIILLLLIAIPFISMSQSIGYLRFDTVKVMKQNGAGELMIINSTKDSVGGLLTNVGGGKTKFVKARVSGDTLFIGGDTLKITGTGGGSFDGITTDLTITGNGTPGNPAKVDTSVMASRLRVQKAIDSLGLIVDSGISFEGVDTDATITGNGTSGSPLKIDTTTYISTKGNVQKVVDDSSAGLRQGIADGLDIVRDEIADSVKTTQLRTDSLLILSLRDSIHALNEKGAIFYDTTTNALAIRNHEKWTYLADLANSMIPNRPNMRLAGAVIRPTVSGSVVTWNFIVDPAHDSIFFSSVSADNSTVNIKYPTVGKIITVFAVPDETLAGKIDVGASVGTDSILLTIKRRYGVHSALFRGNGTTYINATSVFPAYSYTAASGSFFFSGDVSFSIQEPVAIYVGSNGYHLERAYSAFGIYQMKYIVKDMFGNVVTDEPTTDDAIAVLMGDQRISTVNPSTAGGDGWAAATFTGLANIWIFALIEL